MISTSVLPRTDYSSQVGPVKAEINLAVHGSHMNQEFSLLGALAQVHCFKDSEEAQVFKDKHGDEFEVLRVIYHTNGAVTCRVYKKQS